MSEAFANARAFARRGMPVFPVAGVAEAFDGGTVLRFCTCGKSGCQSPGKHPIARLTPRGVKDASTNADQLAAWHKAAPDANWAVSTDKFLVVDQDGPQGGTNLRRLQREHAPLPQTWRVSSGREQSRHYYFSLPEGVTAPCTAGKLAKYIDTRSSGGYVVIPGSLHISGHRYAWWHDRHPRDHAMAEAPHWLLSLLAEPAKRGRTVEDWHTTLTEPIEQGCRDNTLAAIAGKLLHQGLDTVLTYDLLTCVNAARCRPPLPETDLERIVTSIARKHFGKAAA